MPPFDPLVFRTTDLSRWGSGGPLLTEGQADNNFWNLDYRITFIENNPPTAVSISSFTVSGSQFYVNMSDSSVLGPYTLPAVSINPRGTWQPLVNYATNDIFDYNGTVYIVTWPHTSAAIFDAGANDGFGHFYYKIFVPIPGSSLPLGGTTGQVLGKASATDLDVSWQSNSVPPGGVAGQVLTWVSTPVTINGTDYNYQWETLFFDLTLAASLSDVVITSPNSGDMLQFDGTDWVNFPISSLGITFPDIGGVAATSQVRQPTISPLSPSSPSSLDAFIGDGDIFVLTPSNDVTLTASIFPAGARITIIIKTIVTTSYNISFDGNFKSQGTLATGTVSTKTFTITFVCDGSKYYETSRTAAM